MPISCSIMQVSLLLFLVLGIGMRQNSTAHVCNASSVMMPSFAHHGLHGRYHGLITCFSCNLASGLQAKLAHYFPYYSHNNARYGQSSVPYISHQCPVSMKFVT